MIEYNKLHNSIENLNREGVKAIKNGNIEYGKQILIERDKEIAKIKEYEVDHSVTTGNLRSIVYILLKEASLTIEEFDKKLGCTVGTINKLLNNEAVNLETFNQIFEYFEMGEIKDGFKRYIR